jgi:hypothetical protein
MKNMFLSIAIFFAISFSQNSFASLSVHPQKLVDTIYSSQKGDISFHITNLGPSGSLGYQISASENWITLSNSSGNIKVNDSVSVEIKIETAKLKPGINKANITIGDPHHGPLTIPIEVFVNSTTDVYESSEDNSLKLQAYPNPFYSATQISYTLPKSQNVIINLLDIQGSVIKKVANEYQSEGSHRLTFNGTDLPPGIYFLTLNTPSYSIVRKLILNK